VGALDVGQHGDGLHGVGAGQRDDGRELGRPGIRADEQRVRPTDAAGVVIATKPRPNSERTCMPSPGLGSTSLVTERSQVPDADAVVRWSNAPRTATASEPDSSALRPLAARATDVVGTTRWATATSGRAPASVVAASLATDPDVGREAMTTWSAPREVTQPGMSAKADSDATATRGSSAIHGITPP
jgi:hypothetical protein